MLPELFQNNIHHACHLFSTQVLRKLRLGGTVHCLLDNLTYLDLERFNGLLFHEPRVRRRIPRHQNPLSHDVLKL